MKLYYSKGACSLAPRIIINELGLSCEYISVDLKAKTKKTETGVDFLTINPKGGVPVLVTDSQETLTENAVILQYLANHYQATELLPALDNFKHYRALEWLNYIATELHKGAAPFFHKEYPADLKNKVIIPALKSKFAYIDKHLARNQFLCGDQFTLPDAYLFVILNWMPMFKIDLQNLEHLTQYGDNLRRRASIQQSLQDEGLIEQHEH